MQDIPLTLDFVSLVIVIGIFLGFFISFFVILKSFKINPSNLYMGVFILCVSFSMLEGWLNYTGYIFKNLWATNFSEPFNFIIAPLIYLFTRSQFKNFKRKQQWIHFVPFIFWLMYCIFFFIQPDTFKYNSNVDVMKLDIPFVESISTISDDPFHIRLYVNRLTGISFIVYNFLIIRLLILKSNDLGQNIMQTSNKTLISLRNSLLHFLIVIVMFIVVKTVFENDVGDYIFYIYLTFMFFTTAIQIMNSSEYYNQVSSFLEGPVIKYSKSSLEDNHKELILKELKNKIHDEKFFLKSTASLSGLAKSMNQSSHHVSQVINEKLNKSFFELVASCRVEEAKVILKSDIGKKLTIEEIAEQVGYNSKSAFNTAFKKFTSQTPSAYRDS